MNLAIPESLLNWKDIAVNYQRHTYLDVVEAIKNLFPHFTEERLEAVTTWLYSEGAFVRKTQERFYVGYRVELTPSCIKFYDGLGELITTGSCRTEFLRNLRAEMGNRFMREFGLD
jgi:hypothetical protein